MRDLLKCHHLGQSKAANFVLSLLQVLYPMHISDTQKSKLSFTLFNKYMQFNCCQWEMCPQVTCWFWESPSPPHTPPPPPLSKERLGGCKLVSGCCFFPLWPTHHNTIHKIDESLWVCIQNYWNISSANCFLKMLII